MVGYPENGPLRLSRRAFLRAAVLAAPVLLCGPPAEAARIRSLPTAPDLLGKIGARLRLCRRREWTSAKPRPWKLRAASWYYRLTVHHAGTSANFNTSRGAVMRDLQGILAAHTRLNYGDIGYHFIVDYSGAVWEGRSIAYEGAHVSSANDGNIGVMLLGNYEKQRPSAAQIIALGQLARIVMGHYRMKSERLYGHRDLGRTVCPGRYLYPHVAQIRRGGPALAAKPS